MINLFFSWSSNEKPDFFECADGKHVITNELMCDGRIDCDDESDESDETCQDVTCGEDAFRCQYGACVGKESLCDNVNDCRDESDETDESCKDK